MTLEAVERLEWMRRGAALAEGSDPDAAERTFRCLCGHHGSASMVLDHVIQETRAGRNEGQLRTDVETRHAVDMREPRPTPGMREPRPTPDEIAHLQRAMDHDTGQFGPIPEVVRIEWPDSKTHPGGEVELITRMRNGMWQHEERREGFLTTLDSDETLLEVWSAIKQGARLSAD